MSSLWRSLCRLTFVLSIFGLILTAIRGRK